MIFKYIIINCAYAVLFSPGLRHDEIASRMLSGIGNITGAGWVRFHTEILPSTSETNIKTKIAGECYGESTSLEIKSKPEDIEVIMNPTV